MVQFNKALGSALTIRIPPDRKILSSARKLAGEKNSKVEDIAIISAQDPIISIELLRVANAVHFSGDKSAIITIKSAILRLGSAVVIETLDSLLQREKIRNKQLGHWLKLHRSRSKRCGIISRMIAETKAGGLKEQCHASGIMAYIGEMLAVLHFEDLYVELADKMSRSALYYKLYQQHKFDTEKIGLSYLKKYGIPPLLLFPMDRELAPDTPNKAIMRPIVNSAVEMIDAFDGKKWDRLAPGKTLPPKSSIRILQFTDSQYLKLYERASEYLFDPNAKENRWATKDGDEGSPSGYGIGDEEVEFIYVDTKEAEYNTTQFDPISSKEAGHRALDEQFSLKKIPGDKKPARQIKEEDVQAEKLSTAKGTQILESVGSLLNDAKTSEELLSNLLQKLIDEGRFKRTALIVVSKDKSKAIVVASRGTDLNTGQTLSLEDPLSPLAHCYLKIQSFGSRAKDISPFESRSYAIAPIDADHDTPVALYADNGDDEPLTFEARRVFRAVVEILNKKLPSVPGGIPVELET